MPRWKQMIVLVEVLGGLGGFPGIGWLLSGIGKTGLPLALFGPAVAWGILPMLVSPFGGYMAGESYALVVYLIVSSAVSSLFLAGRLRREAKSADSR